MSMQYLNAAITGCCHGAHLQQNHLAAQGNASASATAVAQALDQGASANAVSQALAQAVSPSPLQKHTS